MTDANSDGIWETTISLAAGSYEYKFSYSNWSGEETLISGSSCTITIGTNTNRTLSVGSTAMVLPSVCWNSCLACGVSPAPPLQPAGLVANSPTTSSIFVACGPNQVGGNNILYRLFYSPTATAPMNPQTASEYTFGTTAGDGNGVGPFGFNVSGLQAATNYTFWLYQYNTADQLFSTPASVSETTLGGGTAVPITFTVDMNQSTMPAGSIPEVNGTFNNWCGSCASMTDANADGIWEIIIPLAAGSYQYKFSYSNWTGQELLMPGSSCTITTGINTNRALTVGSVAMVLPSVCWNSCSSCATGPTSSILSGSSAICAGDSTNLSVQIVGGTSPFTVVITDGPNNYSSSGTSPVLFTVSPTLTTTTYSIVSVSGGGVGTGNSGTATVSVTPNSINSLTISASGSYTWTNNSQTYTTSGTYTGTTTNCVTEQLILTITGAGLEDLSEMGISMQPNPSNGLFSIMNSEQVNLTASITDCSGRVIYSANFSDLENTIDISIASRGIYYLKLSSLNYSKVVQIFKN
ncbi:MAG: T9SS C-terminal target domain-containing protein [Crocinitomicaceae bacterium]|nr:T9SS C-terminal target domain-containing protein [Crocinitomicaceae bacterium]